VDLLPDNFFWYCFPVLLFSLNLFADSSYVFDFPDVR
jgi:hypothetical protein